MDMVAHALDGGSVAFPARDPPLVLYEEVRGRIGERDFETWFRGTSCDFLSPDRFVITAPNRFRQAWVEKHYRETLLNSARILFDIEPRLEFRVSEAVPREPSAGAAAGTRAAGTPAAPSSGPARPAPAGARSKVEPGAPASPLDTPSLRPRDLNPEFTFENFVTGPSNRVAHAAAIAVAERPGTCYNPLFVYGDLGVGKTHLLHALCHRLLRSGRIRIAYFTSEAFVSQFVASMSDSSLDAFRAQCRSADVLVVDDVQFFAKKERSQEELFHTLNDLLEAKKQVIVSSICSPRETSGIHERLTSRFRSGLLTRLERPDFETRVAILLGKARARNHVISTEVAEYVARHLTSLREIEGALARLVHLASLRQCAPDLATARLALQEILEEDRVAGGVTIAQILQAVQDFFGLKARELLSRSKVRGLVYARQIGMFLARELTPLSLEEIGMHFGGRDHTTVLYALERVDAMLQARPQVRSEIQLLKSRIAAQDYF
jgi:chromosomal replication initiator protein